MGSKAPPLGCLPSNVPLSPTPNFAQALAGLVKSRVNSTKRAACSRIRAYSRASGVLEANASYGRARLPVGGRFVKLWKLTVLGRWYSGKLADINRGSGPSAGSVAGADDRTGLCSGTFSSLELSCPSVVREKPLRYGLVWRLGSSGAERGGGGRDRTGFVLREGKELDFRDGALRGWFRVVPTSCLGEPRFCAFEIWRLFEYFVLTFWEK